MDINMEKLAQYVTDGSILEFELDQACLEYFNTYDFQNLASIEAMKDMQGRYGFNVENKRYHVNNDFALDVYLIGKGNIYYDIFGKIAIIEEKMLFPHSSALQKKKSYVLSVYSVYNGNFLSFRSIYETEMAAIEKLMEFSCGEWTKL